MQKTKLRWRDTSICPLYQTNKNTQFRLLLKRQNSLIMTKSLLVIGIFRLVQKIKYWPSEGINNKVITAYCNSLFSIFYFWNSLAMSNLLKKNIFSLKYQIWMNIPIGFFLICHEVYKIFLHTNYCTLIINPFICRYISTT